VLAGFAIPPTSSVLRSMWPHLLRANPRLLQPAYALDSVIIEVIFIAGPLLTAVLTAVVSPQAALIVSAASVVAGTLLFTSLPPSRDWRPEKEGRAGMLGALASPGVRSLVIVSLPAGMALGICEIALPAFADAEGSRELAGVLLAVWSLGSVAGGLVYGALPSRPPLDKVHLAVAALLPLSLLPLAAAPSIAVMGLLVIPAGLFIAPLLATRNELVGHVAPPSSRTEAYTWPVTAFVGGISIGSALAGLLVEGPGWRVAFLVASGIAATGAIIVLARRETLVPAVP